MTDLKEKLLGLKPSRIEPVEVPEIGATLYVRSLTARERDLWEQSLVEFDAEGKRTTHFENLRARLVVLCTVDEKGERIFADDEAEAVGKMDSLVIGRLHEAAEKVNRLGAAGVAEAKKN